MGGAVYYQALSSSLVLPRGCPRVVYLHVTTSSLTVDLPNALFRVIGGPQFYIVNGGTESIELRDSAEGHLEDIVAERVVVVTLVNSESIAGVWSVSSLRTLSKLVS